MSKLNVKDTNINCSIEMWAALTFYVTSDCQFVVLLNQTYILYSLLWIAPVFYRQILFVGRLICPVGIHQTVDELLNTKLL
jgi:hypothetical protein